MLTPSGSHEHPANFRRNSHPPATPGDAAFRAGRQDAAKDVLSPTCQKRRAVRVLSPHVWTPAWDLDRLRDFVRAPLLGEPWPFPDVNAEDLWSADFKGELKRGSGQPRKLFAPE